MSVQDEDFAAELADSGDDRPGLDELAGDDFSALELDDAETLDETSDDEFDEDDDDYPEDATEDEIDLVVALYREDARASGAALTKDLANDLDEFISQLRRVPGDAGALGVVSIDNDFFVIVRVRGRHVQVLVSDDAAANDWPIARDALDFLGLDLPDEDDDSAPAGDLDMLADVGVPELELETMCSDYDNEPLDVLESIIEKLGFADAYSNAVAEFDL